MSLGDGLLRVGSDAMRVGGSHRPELRNDVFSIVRSWQRAVIALERVPRPQEQRVARLRNYLHPPKAVERSGALRRISKQQVSTRSRNDLPR